MDIRGRIARIAMIMAMFGGFSDSVRAQPPKVPILPEPPASMTPVVPLPAAASPAVDLLHGAPPDEKKYPSVNVGGVFQADAGWFAQDEANLALFGRINNGADFRRARLQAFGSVTENVDYRLQMDFAFFGRPTFTDLYFDVHELPLLGNVRVGQWKQFFGLEEITSFRFNPFLERASTFIFQPFRRIGIGFYDHSKNERLTWGASFIGGGQDQFGGSLATIGGEAMTARVTFNPVYEDEGRRVLHVGAAYYLDHPNNQTLRFGAIGGNTPEFGLFSGTIGTPSFTSPPNTPSFVDTGVMPASLQNLWGAEVALVRGPLSVQSEFNFNLVNRIGLPQAYFWGGYVYATWFLTGEHRVYNRKQAVFDRVTPTTPFNPRRNGRLLGGAWEVGYRLSYIDLDSQEILGGRLLDQTVALNWYLNGYTKVSFNYINALLYRGAVQPSDTHVFALRGQVDF